MNTTFSALADPTRRQIVDRLSRGERTVGEIAEPLHMSLPAVSKHLGVLEKAGLLTRRREGRVHHLSLRAEPMRNAAAWMAHYEKFWTANLDSLARFVEEGEPKSNSKTPRKK